MSFRGGRGRGRGGGGRFGGGRFGGGNFHPGKQVTWDVFPELESLGYANVVEKVHLAKYYTNLQKYWKYSPYYYEDNNASSTTLSTDIERYSDKISDKSKAKPPLSDFIIMTPEYVPAELARGAKRHKTKKIQWDPEKDMKKLDVFEKLEKKRGPDEKDEDEGSENEEEDEENGEDADESSTDGDYNQNVDFDDDEDDFNPPEENDDEPTYDD